MSKKILVLSALSLASSAAFAAKTPEQVDAFFAELNKPTAETFLAGVSDPVLEDYIVSLFDTNDFEYNKESSKISLNDVLIKDAVVQGSTPSEKILIDSLEFSVDDMRKVLLGQVDLDKVILHVKGVKVPVPPVYQENFSLPSTLNINVDVDSFIKPDGKIVQAMNVDVKELVRISYEGKLLDATTLWNNIRKEDEMATLHEQTQLQTGVYSEYTGYHPFMKSLSEDNPNPETVYENAVDFFGASKVDSYSFEFVNKGLFSLIEKVYPPFAELKTGTFDDLKGLENSKLSAVTKAEIIKFITNPVAIGIYSDFNTPVSIAEVFKFIKNLPSDENELTETERNKITEELFELFPTILKANHLKD